MKKGVVAALALAAAALAGPAAGQQAGNEKGIYLGASGGYSKFQSACDNLAVPCDDDSTAVRGFVGYRFNRYWAAELGGGQLGRAQGSGDLGAGPVSFDQKSYGGDLSVLGSVPIVGGLSFFGRLGAYMTRTTLDQQATGLQDTHDAKTQSGFTYGLGVAWQLGFLGLRAEWQRYDNIGIPAFGKDDLDLFMLGALIQF